MRWHELYLLIKRRKKKFMYIQRGHALPHRGEKRQHYNNEWAILQLVEREIIEQQRVIAIHLLSELIGIIRSSLIANYFIISVCSMLDQLILNRITPNV